MAASAIAAHADYIVHLRSQDQYQSGSYHSKRAIITCSLHDGSGEYENLVFSSLNDGNYAPTTETVFRFVVKDTQVGEPGIVLRFQHYWFLEGPASALSEFTLNARNMPYKSSESFISYKKIESPSSQNTEADSKHYEKLCKDVSELYSLPIERIKILAGDDSKPLWSVQLEYDARKIIDLNLVTNTVYHEKMDPQWSRFRNHLKNNGKITFHVLIQYPKLDSTLNSVKEKIISDAPRFPSWSAEIPDPTTSQEPSNSSDAFNMVEKESNEDWNMDSIATFTNDTAVHSDVGVERTATEDDSKEVRPDASVMNNSEKEFLVMESATVDQTNKKTRIASDVERTSQSILDWWPNERIIPQVKAVHHPESYPESFGTFQITYSDEAHYLTTQVYAAIQSQQESDKKCEPSYAEVRFALIPGAQKGKMIMFIKQKSLSVIAEKGDTFRLCPLDDPDSRYRSYEGYFTDAINFTPPEHFTTIVWPSNFRDSGFDDYGVGTINDAEDDAKLDDEQWKLEIPDEYVLETHLCKTYDMVREKLYNLKPLGVTIKIQQSSLPFRRQIAAINSAWNKRTDLRRGQQWNGPTDLNADHPKNTFDLMMAVGLATHHHTKLQDLFNEDEEVQASITETVQTVSSSHNLDLEQKAALLNSIKSIGFPSGIQIINGGAGTGKTQVEMGIIEIIMRIIQKYPKEKVRILLLTSTNHQTNTTAARVQKLIETTVSSDSTRPFVLTRGHAVDSEKGLLYKKMNISTKKSPASLNEDSLWIVTQELKLMLQNSIKPMTTGSNDNRIVHDQLSVAHRILQSCGLLPIENRSDNIFQPKDDTKLQNLIQFLATVQDDIDFDKQTKEQLTKSYSEARDYVLSELTDVLVCTTSAAISSDYYTRFNADLILFDEASRISELEFAAVCWWYQNAKIKWLAGDNYQLQPYTEVEEKKQIFCGAIGVSVMSRFIGAGYPSIQLTSQHRCHLDINTILNHLVYKRQKMSLVMARRNSLMDEKVDDAFNILFPRTNHRVVWIEKKGKAERQSGGTSLKNQANADISLYLIMELIVKHGFRGKDVLGVIPYRAQVALYRHLWKLAIQSIRKNHTKSDKYANAFQVIDELEQVNFVTWDEAQGTEAPVIIVDTVITDQIGFLVKINRWVAALSRAIDGIILIGSKRQLQLYAETGQKADDNANEHTQNNRSQKKRDNEDEKNKSPKFSGSAHSTDNNTNVSPKQMLKRSPISTISTRLTVNGHSIDGEMKTGWTLRGTYDIVEDEADEHAFPINHDILPVTLDDDEEDDNGVDDPKVWNMDMNQTWGDEDADIDWSGKNSAHIQNDSTKAETSSTAMLEWNEDSGTKSDEVEPVFDVDASLEEESW